ncbi:type 1 glutamine amidotransferase [Sphaerimonospora cavernae]|uniref:Type 1 glutamine amidotransferase n=1 Tax=Sphaerimonospora cavernae TaxID=1740611 RepID=A0ABV6UD10_9ACTN
MNAPVILAVQHEDGAGPGLIGTRIAAAEVKLDLRHPWQGDTLPRSLEGVDGFLVLGGIPGVDDVDLAPWLPAVADLLRQAVRDEIPTLGVCLGGQLLAHACGGTVAKAATPQIGLFPLTARPAAAQDALFTGLPDDACAIQWHYDAITELPPGAVPLLFCPDFPNQAYRLGPAAWGVQFHPEVLLESTERWARSGAGQLTELGMDASVMLAEIAAAEPALRELWGRIADRWIDLATRHAAAGEDVAVTPPPP